MVRLFSRQFIGFVQTPMDHNCLFVIASGHKAHWPKKWVSNAITVKKIYGVKGVTLSLGLTFGTIKCKIVETAICRNIVRIVF